MFGYQFDEQIITGATKKRFTSYDRSATTGLDYAVNRHYDPLQGRFTTVDPIGAGASSISDPQSFNLYAYCGNDPVNHLDPEGLSWLSKLFGWVGKALKIIAVALLVATAIVFTVIGLAPAGSLIFKAALWTLFHVLLPLAHALSYVGISVPGLGMLGTPTWNPGAKGGNFWQNPQDPLGAPDADGNYDPGDVVRIWIFAKGTPIWEFYARGGIRSVITETLSRRPYQAASLPSIEIANQNLNKCMQKANAFERDQLKRSVGFLYDVPTSVTGGTVALQEAYRLTPKLRAGEISHSRFATQSIKTGFIWDAAVGIARLSGGAIAAARVGNQLRDICGKEYRNELFAAGH